MSISLNINRFERLSGRLFLLLSHEKKGTAQKNVAALRGVFRHELNDDFSMLHTHSHPGVGGKPCLFKPVTF